MNVVADIDRLTTHAVWDVKTLEGDRSWTCELSADDVAELRHALAHAKRLGYRDLEERCEKIRSR